MKRIIAGSLAAVLVSMLLYAQVVMPVVTIGPAQCLTQASDGADTNQPTAWTKSSDGGPWSGGFLYSNNVNDGRFPNSQAGTTGHMQFLRVNAIDPYNVNNTSLTVINAMPAYDHTVFTTYGTAGRAWYGSNPWSQNGIIYWGQHIQDSGTPFGTYTTDILCSKDKGVTWSNYANWIANTNACPATGDASGAFPAANDSSNTQWPIALSPSTNSFTAFMGKITLVQTNQDGATPPTIPGVDTTYTYFLTLRLKNNGGDHALYAHRVLTANDPMNPSNWNDWNGSSYVNASPSSGQDIMPSAWVAGTFSITAMYDANVFHKFFISASNAGVGSKDLFGWADKPEGPITPFATIATPGGSFGSGFPTFVLPTYQTFVFGGFSIMMGVNGYSGDSQTPSFNTIGYQRANFRVPNVSIGTRSAQ